MSFIANRLMDETRLKRPDLYSAICNRIRPYSLDSVLKVFDHHLRNIPDLSVFNENVALVPDFVWTVIKHMKFPTPGDAFGINVACRVTKSETQGTLDSKHLKGFTNSEIRHFAVDRNVSEELSHFTKQQELFDLSSTHKYSTVFMSHDTDLEELLQRLPKACILQRGDPFNKGRNASGRLRYLNMFDYILVEDRGSNKVLYKSQEDLYLLLRCVPLKSICAYSDVRSIFKKCGITCSFMNTLEVARRQLFVNDGSKYEKDVITLLTFMYSRPIPLPLNREGLAKNKDRTPIDVLSFEAMKKNCSKFATGPDRGKWHKVTSSFDRIFTGQTFNEGTGYTDFAIFPDDNKESEWNRGQIAI